MSVRGRPFGWGWVETGGGGEGVLRGSRTTQGGGTQVGFSLDPTSDRFLREHTQYGRPLLPAVMAAELLAQSVRSAGLVSAVEELCDVRVGVARQRRAVERMRWAYARWLS